MSNARSIKYIPQYPTHPDVVKLVEKLMSSFKRYSISDTNPYHIAMNPLPKFAHIHTIYILRDGRTTEREIMLELIQRMSGHTHCSNICTGKLKSDNPKYFRESINAFLGSNLSEDDFKLMYQLLYKDDAAERFIESGFSTEYLKQKYKLYQDYINY